MDTLDGHNMALVQTQMDEVENAPLLDGSEKSEDGNAHSIPAPCTPSEVNADSGLPPGLPAPCTPDSSKKRKVEEASSPWAKTKLVVDRRKW